MMTTSSSEKESKNGVVKIKEDGPKAWWSGDERVEPYMHEIANALDSCGIKNQDRTTIYNKCYEAVYSVIVDKDNKNEQYKELKMEIARLSQEIRVYQESVKKQVGATRVFIKNNEVKFSL